MINAWGQCRNEIYILARRDTPFVNARLNWIKLQSTGFVLPGMQYEPKSSLVSGFETLLVCKWSKVLDFGEIRFLEEATSVDKRKRLWLAHDRSRDKERPITSRHLPFCRHGTLRWRRRWGRSMRSRGGKSARRKTASEHDPAWNRSQRRDLNRWPGWPRRSSPMPPCPTTKECWLDLEFQCLEPKNVCSLIGISLIFCSVRFLCISILENGPFPASISLFWTFLHS